MIWFTSDQHFGHANIIKYCARPFSSVEEMDETIIRNFNYRVSKGDVVYHLGDFIFGDRGPYLKRMNGTHVFIRGNHDNKKYKDPYIREIKIEGQHIVLCHYAMRVWNRSHHGSWNLYGHSHGTLVPQRLQMDVGVDSNGYYPISFDWIKELLQYEKPENNFLNLPGVVLGTVPTEEDDDD